MKKIFLFFMIIFTFNFSFLFSESPEDIEINRLKEQIKLFQNEIKILEKKKIKRFKESEKQPKVGLVLSGGGAKGFAHIGALKVLEENNIKVDYITGTSMGAVVGALYSVGYTPDQIEKLVLDINWQETFNDSPNLADISIDQRSLMKNYNLSLKYDSSLNFTFPKGIRNTQKIYLILKNLLRDAEEIKDFKRLPIPINIIATDLNTGKAKVFNSGDLAQVITASISIPTVFDPVVIDGNHYVDGLLSRNFPVEDAFNLGADIVIGVDVGSSLQRKEEYDILSILDQVVTIQSTSSTKKQRDLATILIKPDITNYKTTDFNDFEEIKALGKTAAREQISKILAFNPKKNKNKKSLDVRDDFVLEKLEIVSETKNENYKEIIQSIFKDSLGESVDSDTLESLMLKTYSLSFVNKVYYSFDDTTLKVQIEEIPTNILGIGVDYQTDYGTTFTIGTDINSFGKIGTLSTVEGTFGDYLGFNLNNFSYYGVSNKIGIFSSISYSENPFNLYNGKDKIGSYKSQAVKLESAFITQYSNLFLFSYGASLNYSNLDSEIKNTLDTSLEYSKSYGDIFFNINWDKTDSVSFPTKGFKGEISQRWGGNLGKDDLNFLSTNYMSHIYIPITKTTTLTTKIFSANVSGDDILADKYIKLGGLSDDLSQNSFSFSGYYFQEKYLSSLFGVSLGVQKKIIENLYLIAHWDIATYKYADEDLAGDDSSVFWKDYSQGASIGLSYSSLIGPLNFSVSKAGKSRDSIFQFSFGYKFN